MIGQRLAHYQITAKLGEGGMGVVYRATDGKLGREVAIKVLPSSVAQSPERLARFQREARTLASLNHPNVAAVYGVEEGALVMELVEGPTLYDRIKSGPIPVEEALAIARQITQALEAAHEKGIIHRDLKPANVKVTEDGAVKLLDFGLAKAMQDESIPGDRENSPTMTQPPSMTGVIMGTAGYMSPEQARGAKVDRRTDIWAFGVVLYEMLTGRPLFRGETAPDTLAEVLTKEAGLERVPARFRPLLRRCLQRDATKRLGWIGDARLELDEAPAALETTQKRRWLAPVLAAALVAALGIIVGILARRPTATDLPVRRFTIPVKDLSPATAIDIAISPDGKRIVYVAGNRLWVRDLDREEAREIPGTQEAMAPFWSPDGRQIGFRQGQGIFKVGLTGESLLPVCQVSGAFYGGSWSLDGASMLLGVSTGITIVPAAGGEPRMVLRGTGELAPPFHRPTFLPPAFGDDWILAGSGPLQVQQMIAVQLGTGKIRRLGQGNNPTYSKDGHILFSRAAGSLYAASYTPDAPDRIGEAFLVSPVATMATVAADGTLVFPDSSGGQITQLAVRDRDGKFVRKVGAPQMAMVTLSVSADGRRAAVSSVEQGSPDVWIHDLERGLKSRFTFDAGAEFFPKFSPDGGMIAYATNRKGNGDVLIQSSDGTGEPAEAAAGPVGEFPTDWSADGKFIIATFFSPLGTRDIWYLKRKEGSGGFEAVPFLTSPFDETSGRISPNGRYLAYRSSESGKPAIYVRPLPAGVGKWQVTGEGAAQPRWSRNGKELYHVLGDVLMATEVNTDGAFTVGATRRLFATGSYDTTDVSLKYDTLPDGRFLIIEPVEDGEKRAAAIHVVQNWLAASRPAR